MDGSVLERVARPSKVGTSCALPSRRGAWHRNVELRIATAADDADLRRLLRESPMAGRIRLTLEREPDFFAAFGGAEQQTIVARVEGRLACAGWCAFRERYVNGTPRRVGYLAGLRLHPDFAGRFDLARRGYEFFHELQRPRPADCYFTSIATDNHRARRFLERELPGLPRYTPLAEFVTLLLPAAHGRSHPADEDGGSPEERATRLNQHNRPFQLAPCWPAEELRALAAENARPVTIGDGRASATLWDQRAVRQTVVRGYAPTLRLARPVLNALPRWLTPARLPAPGVPLAHAFAAQLALGPEDGAALLALTQALRHRAAAAGLDYVTFGFDARDPRLMALRRLGGGREYRSQLYAVSWDDLPATPLNLTICAPEAALL